MKKAKAFEVPYVVGGWIDGDNSKACACDFTTTCGSEYSACVDQHDDDCGWGFAFGVIGIIIAAVPSNAIPG